MFGAEIIAAGVEYFSNNPDDFDITLFAFKNCIDNAKNKNQDLNDLNVFQRIIGNITSSNQRQQFHIEEIQNEALTYLSQVVDRMLKDDIISSQRHTALARQVVENKDTIKVLQATVAMNSAKIRDLNHRDKLKSFIDTIDERCERAELKQPVEQATFIILNFAKITKSLYDEEDLLYIGTALRQLGIRDLPVERYDMVKALSDSVSELSQKQKRFISAGKTPMLAAINEYNNYVYPSDITVCGICLKEKVKLVDITTSLAVELCAIYRESDRVDKLLETTRHLFFDYEISEAIPYLLELSELGVGDAKFMLSLLYHHADQIEQRVKVIQEGAESGHKICSAMFYRNSRPELLQQIEEDAYAGDVLSQYYLGSFYIVEDDNKAGYFMKMAADNGMVFAEAEYGCRYHDNINTYLKSAASKGYPFARALYANRLIIDNPVVETLEFVLGTYRELIKDEYAVIGRESFYSMLISHLNSYTKKEYQTERFNTLQKAVSLYPDNFEFKLELGKCYYEGIGTGEDYYEAIHYFTTAKKGFDDKGENKTYEYSEILYYLGLCNYYGNGIVANRALAYDCFHRSYEKICDSNKYLAKIWNEGYMGTRDSVRAAVFLKLYIEAYNKENGTYPPIYKDKDLIEIVLCDKLRTAVKNTSHQVYFYVDTYTGKEKIDRIMSKVGANSTGSFLAFVDTSRKCDGSSGYLFTTQGLTIGGNDFVRYDELSNTNRSIIGIALHGIFNLNKNNIANDFKNKEFGEMMDMIIGRK